MKKLLLCATIAVAMCFASCEKFDASDILDRLDNVENQLDDLKNDEENNQGGDNSGDTGEGNTRENNKIYYTTSDNTKLFPKTDASLYGAILISNTYKDGQGILTFDDNITSIGNSAFSACTSLTSITIPDSVTSIGSYAFEDCSSLTSVTIGNSVTSIGNYAFYGCSSLTNITIPDSVTSIGEEAFGGCSSLTRVDISDLSAWCKIVFSNSNSNPCSNGAKLYLNGNELTEFTIPSDITEIKNYAFSGYSSLASVTIPDSVSSIGSYVFDGCTSLTSVTIGNGVTSIGEAAFNNTTKLSEIIFQSEDVPTLGSNTFDATRENNPVIYVPDNAYVDYISSDWPTEYKRWIPINLDRWPSSQKFEYTTKDNMAINITADTFNATIAHNIYENGKGSVYTFETIASIGMSAFRGCSSLTSVTIGNSVTWIGYGAFDNCTSLTSVTIPDSVTSIGSSTFYGCSSLTSVTIGNSVTSIGGYVFYGCSSLTTITIPDSVTLIESYAFSDCSSLKAFYGKFASPDNRALIVDNCIIAYACDSGTTYTIPDSVTSIGEYTFYDCSSLTSVTIPDSVTSIGNDAFSGCSSLTTITIPDSVTSIGKWAFYECSSLTAFYGKFASSDNRCLIIDGVLHSFAPSGLTSYTIPDSVTSIGDEAFSRCSSLTSVTIPDSVTSIGHYAFYDCSSLTEVYCKPITPPTGGYHIFYSNASGRKIYVPTASVEAYKTADGWSDYADYIVGYDF